MPACNDDKISERDGFRQNICGCKDKDLTLTFQNVAAEAGGEGTDVEAPPTDAAQD